MKKISLISLIALSFWFVTGCEEWALEDPADDPMDGWADMDVDEGAGDVDGGDVEVEMDDVEEQMEDVEDQVEQEDFENDFEEPMEQDDIDMDPDM